MTQEKAADSQRRWPAILLYLLGVLLMPTVTALMIWPEIELLMFDRPLVVEERFRALRCPLAVTRQEDATIAATFRNDSERSERFRTRARFSYFSARVLDELDQWVELEPGEAEVVRWSLDPESAAFGRMILARVHVSRRGPMAPQQAGCGVMVLNVPFFTGNQIMVSLTAAGLLALAGSGLLWLQGRPPALLWQNAGAGRWALLALALAGAMVAGLFSLWLLGAVLLLISAVLLVSLMQYWA